VSPVPTGAVVIGRNEGERLVRCLRSLEGRVDRIVYVDSGSTDDSVAAAGALGAEVVPLDMTRPFTAARARNVGFERLCEGDNAPPLVQFIDGDCELLPRWIEAAAAFLAVSPDVAAVCGRLRERHPDASIYNRLADYEWDTPVGPALACGGIAMMRSAAFQAAGGFNEDLIAGEEPELCLRLRRTGWKIWKLDCDMALHDAAMTRFGQWWQRARRAGYTYAEAAAMHGRGPDRHGVRSLLSALGWGVGLPGLALVGALAVSPWLLLSLLAVPAQVLRLGRRDPHGLTRGAFLVLAKLPESQGALTWAWRRLRRSGTRLIEYK
jgi:GT2 family glycosyltransferase